MLSQLRVRRSPDGKIAYIGLTKGKVAIVDAADFDWLNRYRWSAWEHGGTFYARRLQGEFAYLNFPDPNYEIKTRSKLPD